MSRASILATTAIAVLGTTSLVPVDASARTATSYTHRSAAVVRNVSVSRPVATARPMVRPMTVASTSHIANMTRLSHVHATNAVGGLNNVRSIATPGVGGVSNVRNVATNGVASNVQSFKGRDVLRATATAPTPSTAQQITDLMNKSAANKTAAQNTIGLVNNINKGADAAAAEAQRQRNIADAALVLGNKNPGNAQSEFKRGLEASQKAVELDQRAAELRADAAARLKTVPGLLRLSGIEARMANRLANGGGTDGATTTTGGTTTGGTTTGGTTTGGTNTTPGTNGTCDPIACRPLTGPVTGGGTNNPNVPNGPIMTGPFGPKGPVIVIRPPVRLPVFPSSGGSVFQTASGPTIPQGQVSSLPPPTPAPQQVAPQASNCLQKSYLQSGFVMFNDICTNERAVNSTTTQVASAANCLTKQNPQSGGVLFQDTCTGEWAQNAAAR